MSGLGLGLGLSSGSGRPQDASDFRSVSSAAGVLGWIYRTGGGASGAKPRWPGMATTGGGLATLHPSANWSLEGVQFSRDASLPAPTDASTLSWWNAANQRLFFGSTTPLDRFTLSNLSIPGYVDVTNSTALITMTHCIVDGGEAKLYGIQADSTGISPIDVRNCEFTGQTNMPIIFPEGTVRDCYLHECRSDAFRVFSSEPKLILRNMAHRLGVNSPGAHSDVIQTQGDTSNITTFGNMFYLPFSGSTYDEGSYGTTNVLRYATQTGNISDILSANDALIGGGYTVSLNPSPGDLINGAALVGSWFAKPIGTGGVFTGYGSFYPGAASIGTTKNILIHNCRYLEDGSAVQHQGGDASGLWEYDKATAPARFRQICQMLGYTDWNDDPLVTARTGFHVGTVS